MIVVNSVTDESTRISNLPTLFSFFCNYENFMEIKDDLIKYFNKGQTIYWAKNPYQAEIEKKLSVIIGRNVEEVRRIYYSLSEEI